MSKPSIDQLIAAADPERRLAVSYARQRARGPLAALFALDITLGRVVVSTNEPMIGAMRLAWWREALEKLHQPPAPAEPVLQALNAAGLAETAEASADLAALADGWLALVEVETLDREALETHAAERGGRLFDIAGRALGAGSEGVALGAMGRGWALADLARHVSQDAARVEALALARAAFAGRQPRLPRGARPLAALAALARRDARTGGGGRTGSPARQLRMLAALLTGR